MKRKIRLVQFGCGRMGRLTGRFAVEKGCEMVAAMDSDLRLIGKSGTEIFGVDCGDILIADAANADAMFKDLRPDVCIVTTQATMRDVREILLICANNGVNAITSCDEAIYPWNSSPGITAEIDEAAKAGRCTITGSGANETQYGGLFALYGGNAHKTERIKARALWNIDDYGIALAKAYGVGLTKEEFEKEISAADNLSEEARNKLIENGEFESSTTWNTNGWICDYLGLTVSRQKQTCMPVFAEKDINSQTMGAVIPAGRAIGMNAATLTETEEGITIETESIGIVYGQGEEDKNESHSYGRPDTEVFIMHPQTGENTCATIVNRIPDLIDAVSGYVTTSQMPALKFRAKVLNEYVASLD